MGSYVFNGSVDVYLKVKLNLQRLMFLMAVLMFFFEAKVNLQMHLHSVLDSSSMALHSVLDSSSMA